MNNDDPLQAIQNAEARLGKIREQAELNKQRSNELSAASETIRQTVSSPNREVQITAGVGGKIERIEFSDSARGIDLNRLAKLTVETITRAQRAAMEELARQSEGLFGAHSPIANQLRDDAARAYPGPSSGITYE